MYHWLFCNKNALTQILCIQVNLIKPTSINCSVIFSITRVLHISIPDKSHAPGVMQGIDEDMTTTFHTLITLPEKKGCFVAGYCLSKGTFRRLEKRLPESDFYANHTPVSCISPCISYKNPNIAYWIIEVSYIKRRDELYIWRCFQF